MNLRGRLAFKFMQRQDSIDSMGAEIYSEFSWQQVAVRADPREPHMVRRTLDYLVQRGLLDRLASDRAFQAQRQTNERVDVVIVQLGLISEVALTEALADYMELPLASADVYPMVAIRPDLFKVDFLKRCQFLPVAEDDDCVTVVTADPFATDTLTSISYLAGRPVRPYLGHARDIEAAIDRLYAADALQPTGNQSLEEVTVAQDEDVQHLLDAASEAPIIRLVNRLISGAIEARASDIHIEPLADSLRVRYRIDGIMMDYERLPLEVQSGVASRIKILGRLNIAERRIPQDGRTKFVVGGHQIDLRISTAPLMHGESIVLRILNRDAVALDFDTLGFDLAARQTLETLLTAPNGIILVTGPTGSGKTTTLYTALKILNSAERKVFSVEDPIEYQLPGVNQMQIKPNIGLDFVHCLRSILRQDPDVIMIGEMRDVETVRTGIQASLTGHLVLSTLHTNSAAASVTRLLDMGVEHYLLASTLSAIVAQRLVRRLCQTCAEPDPEAEQRLAAVGADLEGLKIPIHAHHVKRPVGCPVCRNLGFKGRTTVYEIMVVDEHIKQMIGRAVTERQLQERAQATGGMETLMQNGLRKVFAGETTLEEVLRVARM
jgi:general secretion pathway protein E